MENLDPLEPHNIQLTSHKTDDTVKSKPTRMEEESSSDEIIPKNDRNEPKVESFRSWINHKLPSQQFDDDTIDLPESSGSESFQSVVLQSDVRIFKNKMDHPQNNLYQAISRPSSVVSHENTKINKTIQCAPKSLFNVKQGRVQSSFFPPDIMKVSRNKTVNKTKEETVVVHKKRDMFFKHPRKENNIFDCLNLSESSESVPEIQPHIFQFQKNQEHYERSSSNIQEQSSNNSLSMEWNHLPSSTMMGQPLDIDCQEHSTVLNFEEDSDEEIFERSLERQQINKSIKEGITQNSSNSEDIVQKNKAHHSKSDLCNSSQDNITHIQKDTALVDSKAKYNQSAMKNTLKEHAQENVMELEANQKQNKNQTVQIDQRNEGEEEIGFRGNNDYQEHNTVLNFNEDSQEEIFEKISERQENTLSGIKEITKMSSQSVDIIENDKTVSSKLDLRDTSETNFIHKNISNDSNKNHNQSTTQVKEHVQEDIMELDDKNEKQNEDEVVKAEQMNETEGELGPKGKKNFQEHNMVLNFEDNSQEEIFEKISERQENTVPGIEEITKMSSQSVDIIENNKTISSKLDLRDTSETNIIHKDIISNDSNENHNQSTMQVEERVQEDIMELDDKNEKQNENEVVNAKQMNETEGELGLRGNKDFQEHNTVLNFDDNSQQEIFEKISERQENTIPGIEEITKMSSESVDIIENNKTISSKLDLRDTSETNIIHKDIITNDSNENHNQSTMQVEERVQEDIMELDDKNEKQNEDEVVNAKKMNETEGEFGLRGNKDFQEHNTVLNFEEDTGEEVFERNLERQEKIISRIEEIARNSSQSVDIVENNSLVSSKSDLKDTSETNVIHKQKYIALEDSNKKHNQSIKEGSQEDITRLEKENTEQSEEEQLNEGKDRYPLMDISDCDENNIVLIYDEDPDFEKEILERSSLSQENISENETMKSSQSVDIIKTNNIVNTKADEIGNSQSSIIHEGEGFVSKDSNEKQNQSKFNVTLEKNVHVDNIMEVAEKNRAQTQIEQMNEAEEQFSLTRSRKSLEPPSDDTNDLNAESSGWDSHRITRKTLMQSFGTDYTSRKSLRMLVMEKSAKRQTIVNDSVIMNIKAANEPQSDKENKQLELTEDQIDLTYREDEQFFQLNQRSEEANHDEHTISLQMNSVASLERQENLENDISSEIEESFQSQQIRKEEQLKKLLDLNVQRNLAAKRYVEKSLQIKPRPVNFDYLSLPARPVKRQTTTSSVSAKTKKAKKSSIIDPTKPIPAELLEDLHYKPPKRYQPKNASWITKRLYKYVETKLEPRYDYKARVRAERFVETLYMFAVRVLRSEGALLDGIEQMKREMAKLCLVSTHEDFHQFVREFLPREVRVKIIPDILNDLPMPKNGVLSNILSVGTSAD